MQSNLKKMKIISIVWGGILLIIVCGLTILGFIYKEKIQKYKDLEENLNNKTKEYIERKNITYPEDFLRIKTEELINNNIIDNTDVEGDTCSGYTLIIKENDHYKFNTYIKCNDYKTPGYDRH